MNPSSPRLSNFIFSPQCAMTARCRCAFCSVTTSANPPQILRSSKARSSPIAGDDGHCSCYDSRSRGNQSMLYLSQVLGRPIVDLEGERVAWLKDVIVRLGEGDHPPVAGFVARYRRRDFFLPRWRISHFDEQGVRLNSD